MIQTFFNHYSQTVSALANPRRLEIIHLLRDLELTVTQLYQMLDFPQANISQHLQVLRDHHLVTARRQGKSIYYKVTDPNILKACDLLRQFVRQQNGFSTEMTVELKELTPLTHDPVCGMQIAPKLSDFSVDYNHQTYFFCASGCQKAFIQRPQKFIL